MKILVTGGAGFLGQAIVRQLLARGDEIRILNRGNYPELATMNIQIISADIGNQQAVLDAASGVDAIIHTASKVDVFGKYQDFYQTNVKGTEYVIKSCLQHKIRYLVYTSSPSVVFAGENIEGADESLPYPDHYLSHYTQTKILAEKAILAANSDKLKTTALRPHLIWGPKDNHLLPHLVHQARSGKLTLIKGPPRLIDTIYVENAADAHLLALDCLRYQGTCAGKAYFISQNEPISVEQFTNMMLAAANLSPVKRYVSPSLAYHLGGLLEICYKLFAIKKQPPITRFIAKQLSCAQWFNTTLAQQDLGYRPKISIEKGMQYLADWLRSFENAKKWGR